MHPLQRLQYRMSIQPRSTFSYRQFKLRKNRERTSKIEYVLLVHCYQREKDASSLPWDFPFLLSFHSRNVTQRGGESLLRYWEGDRGGGRRETATAGCGRRGRGQTGAAGEAEAGGPEEANPGRVEQVGFDEKLYNFSHDQALIMGNCTV